MAASSQSETVSGVPSASVLFDAMLHGYKEVNGANFEKVLSFNGLKIVRVEEDGTIEEYGEETMEGLRAERRDLQGVLVSLRGQIQRLDEENVNLQAEVCQLKEVSRQKDKELKRLTHERNGRKRCAPSTELLVEASNSTSTKRKKPEPSPLLKPEPQSAKCTPEDFVESIIAPLHIPARENKPENRKWNCSCGKQFSTGSKLSFHLKYFNDKWNFKCTICARQFPYLSALKKHMETAHKMSDALKNYFFGCAKCGDYFATKEEYKNHCQNTHA